MLIDPLSALDDNEDGNLDSSFKHVQLLTMQGIYHKYTGRLDLLWEKMGAGICKGVPLGLFDERAVSWTNLTEQQRQY